MLKFKNRPNLYSIAISLMLLAISSILGLGKTASQDIIASPIEAIDWNQDNTLLAVAHTNDVLEIENLIEHSSVAFDLFPSELIDLAWSPIDNNILAVVIGDGTTKIVNISGGEYTVIRNLVGELEYISGLAWNADGTRIITVGTSGTGAGQISKAIVWDAANGDRLATYDDGLLQTDVFWNLLEPSQVILAGIDDGTARILAWDTLTSAVIWLIDEPDARVLSLATSPQGNQFVSAMNTLDGAVVRIHDSSTGTVQSILETNIHYFGAIAWNPGLYLAISEGNGIQIWDADSAQFVSNISVAQLSLAASWSRDGQKLAYGGDDGVSYIIDIPPQPSIPLLPSPTTTPPALNSIYSLAWSPDVAKLPMEVLNSNCFIIRPFDTYTCPSNPKNSLTFPKTSSGVVSVVSMCRCGSLRGSSGSSDGNRSFAFKIVRSEKRCCGSCSCRRRISASVAVSKTSRASVMPPKSAIISGMYQTSWPSAAPYAHHEK